MAGRIFHDQPRAKKFPLAKTLLFCDVARLN